MIGRREFIAGLGGAAAWPLACPCRGVYIQTREPRFACMPGSDGRSGAVVCDRLDVRHLIVGDGGAAPTVEVASKASPA